MDTERKTALLAAGKQQLRAFRERMHQPCTYPAPAPAHRPQAAPSRQHTEQQVQGDYIASLLGSATSGGGGSENINAGSRAGRAGAGAGAGDSVEGASEAIRSAVPQSEQLESTLARAVLRLLDTSSDGTGVGLRGQSARDIGGVRDGRVGSCVTRGAHAMLCDSMRPSGS